LIVTRWLKWILILLAVLLAVFLVVLFTTDIEALKPLKMHVKAFVDGIWLWIVGLLGLFGALFKKISSFFSSSSADKLEEKNETVKVDLARLKEQVAAFETDLKRERELHQREMAVIRKEIDQKEQAVAEARGKVERMKTMTPEEYVTSLTDDERNEYERDINKDVWVFGEGPESGGKP
jgi:hypothetical protein